jgi:hypothetical protein
LTGIAGANVVGSAVEQCNLGALWNTLVGAIGGAAGYFAQTFVSPTVDASGVPSSTSRYSGICSRWR